MWKRFIRLFIHEHKWEIYHTYVPFDSDSLSGIKYVLKCTHCGDLKIVSELELKDLDA